MFILHQFDIPFTKFESCR